MIEYTKFELENGLKIILHEDKSTPLVALNVLYNIGSKNEQPEKTGLAHLFEHLMFSGTKNVPDYDVPVQKAGGENNAYTNADTTNYYSIAPANNLETLLWLEADRMHQLLVSENSLNIQKSVVIEEFKETCLNEPFGEVWHKLYALSYQKHPYQWPTIGKSIDQIESFTIDDIRGFYNAYYNPSNAILSICGNINISEAKKLCQKYFAEIASFPVQKLSIPQEAIQKEYRQKHVIKNVSSTAICLSFHMAERLDDDFYATDLLSDILSNGRSSRLYKNLYKATSIFQNIDAYITGATDAGLLLIDSKIIRHEDRNIAIDLIWNELQALVFEGIEEDELQKVKNKNLSSLNYSEVSILNKALNLCYYQSLGDVELINKQEELYGHVSVDDVNRVAKSILRKENCSVLIYGPEMPSV